VIDLAAFVLIVTVALAVQAWATSTRRTDR